MGVTWEKLKNMDWSQFEGREFEYNNGEEMTTCIIAAADKDIGITAVLKSDLNFRVMCLRGPTAQKDAYTKQEDYDEYSFFAVTIISGIQKGVIDSADFKAWGDPGPVSAEYCAFSQ